MTQRDRDAAALILKCAADDWIRGVRYHSGALLGAAFALGQEDIALAIDSWHWTSLLVDEEDGGLPRWPLVALHAADRLEQGWTP